MARLGRAGAAGFRRRMLLVLVVLAWLVTGCGRLERSPSARAFYYWRTTFALTASEQKALGDLQVDKLYLRAFDVVPGPDGSPELAGVVQVQASTLLPERIEVIPVVFLKNQVFDSAKP